MPKAKVILATGIRKNRPASDRQSTDETSNNKLSILDTSSAVPSQQTNVYLQHPMSERACAQAGSNGRRSCTNYSHFTDLATASHLARFVSSDEQITPATTSTSVEGVFNSALIATICASPTNRHPTPLRSAAQRAHAMHAKPAAAAAAAPVTRCWTNERSPLRAEHRWRS